MPRWRLWNVDRARTITGMAKSTPAVPWSIRVLRKLNPLVHAILASPLHGLLSRDLLILRYRGRRSGRAYVLPLSYVALGERLYLCTRNSRWGANFADRAAVELRLRGRRRQATAAVVSSRSREALDALREFLARNPRTGTLLYDVRPGPNGRPLESDLVREVVRSNVVAIDLSA
jgi:F420H(2)-dependent quinone reductase